MTIKIPHPFPYQGSKRNLASEIAKFIPSNVETLYEPFAGSAALSIYIALTKKVQQFTFGDTNVPLISLWNAIITSPTDLCDRYEIVWHGQFESGEKQHYEAIRQEFNQTKKPEHLLYLLARCVKAAVRYNSNGEFNQGRDKRRSGTQPSKMRESILQVASLLKGRVKLFSSTYQLTIQNVTERDLVYLDPPYQGTSGNKNPRYINGLVHEDFVTTLYELNARQISYIVSYDGRTGTKTHGQQLSKKLCLRHIELYAGRSSQGTLLGQELDTYESLYLSPALLQRLQQNTSVVPQPLLDQAVLLHL